MNIVIVYNTALKKKFKKNYLQYIGNYLNTQKIYNIFYIDKLENINTIKNLNISDIYLIIYWTYFNINNVKEKSMYEKYRNYYKINILHIDSDPLVSYYKHLVNYNYLNKNTIDISVRISLNGVLRTTGDYFTDFENNTNRWENLKKKLNINVKPWRKKGKHILLLDQNNDGFSIQDENMLTWIPNIIKEIRKFSKRRIILKTKYDYRDKFFIPYKITKKIDPLEKTIINTKSNLPDLLNNCWASVSYCTTASVISIIYGIPTFSLNINALDYEISNHSLSDLENPIMPDRTKFLYDLSYKIWSNKELYSDIFWDRFFKYYNENYLKINFHKQEN